jgi:hypothetical protein
MLRPNSALLTDAIHSALRATRQDANVRLHAKGVRGCATWC